jgi:methylglutaconyl-CoA hydratase
MTTITSVNPSPHWLTCDLSSTGITTGIATITLNRPDKHNAFDDHLIQLFITQLQNLAQDASVRGLIITGAGKSFSAGADLAWMQRMAEYDEAANLADAEQLALLMHLLDSFPKPTLALVNGAAFGGAVGLIACCDSVISADSASFCMSEVGIGLIPAVISPFVVNKMGISWSRHLMTSAMVFTANQALANGLAHQVVPLSELNSAKEQWIRGTLGNSPEAVEQIKKLLTLFNTHSPTAKGNLATTTSLTTRAIAKIRVSPNGQAGLKAFLTKTLAPWKE